MFFLLSDLFKVHTFHFYSLNSFSLVYERAIVGRLAAGDAWNEGARPRDASARLAAEARVVAQSLRARVAACRAGNAESGAAS